MQRRRFVLLCLAVIILFSSVTAQEKPISKKVIKIGGDYSFPPYVFNDEKDIPKGYYVELTQAIAEVMGFDVEFRLGKWAKVSEWLDRGEIDVVQGMSYTKDSGKKYEFSMPIAETWRTYFVRKDSQFKEVIDLKNAQIVIQTGDIANDYLKQIGFEGTKFYTPNQEEALALLASGKFDTAIVNLRHGLLVKKRHKLSNIVMLGEPFAPRYPSYAVKKSNSALLSDFNTGLMILKESGKFDEIHKKWLKEDKVGIISSQVFMGRIFKVVVPLFLALLFALIWIWFLRRQIIRKSLALQQELESRLKYESELNREYKMFVNGPVIVYKLQGDPHVISYISENIRQFGYDPKDLFLHKKTLSDMIFSEDRDRVFEHLAKDLAEGNEFSVKQFRILTADGQICWVFDYTLIIREYDNTVWYYGYMLDITAQKTLEAELLEAKEKAETANIAKGHFLSNISHEIRTPLNGIIGFIQVLMKTELSQEQIEYMDLINSSGKNLMKIVNDILDFSKMESGKLDLIVTDFNPRFLIEDVIKSFSVARTNPAVDLRMRVNEKIPPIVYGDMMRLRQILINLMQNALKFTESGFVEITADVYNQIEDEIRIIFAVRDTGVGIDPMKQRDIFENFMQADPSITRKYGGTGLGLSIVKKLVSIMGGFIWVESEPEKGSNFFFIINFKTKAAERPRFEEHLEIPEEERQPLPQLRVLLVEDEPINQLVTKKQLERWNLSVMIAVNGKEALELMQENRFDCILMDIQMPELDGISATSIIRAKETESGEHIPIIAFTAAAMAGDKERFLASGMDDYIAKPIDIDHLYRILEQVKK